MYINKLYLSLLNYFKSLFFKSPIFITRFKKSLGKSGQPSLRPNYQQPINWTSTFSTSEKLLLRQRKLQIFSTFPRKSKPLRSIFTHEGQEIPLNSYFLCFSIAGFRILRHSLRFHRGLGGVADLAGFFERFDLHFLGFSLSFLFIRMRFLRPRTCSTKLCS